MTIAEVISSIYESKKKHAQFASFMLEKGFIIDNRNTKVKNLLILKSKLPENEIEEDY